MCDVPAQTVTGDLSNPQNLLDAFRVHYTRFETLVHQAVINPTDSVVLARLGDDLDEFLAMVVEVRILTIIMHH